jgi:hypothetical protein
LILFHRHQPTNLTSQHEGLGKSSLVYIFGVHFRSMINIPHQNEGKVVTSTPYEWDDLTPIRSSLQCLMIYLHFIGVL